MLIENSGPIIFSTSSESEEDDKDKTKKECASSEEKNIEKTLKHNIEKLENSFEHPNKKKRHC